MTTIDITEINARARRVRPGRALLALLALVPFLLGWSAAALVTAASWTWAAAIVGWQTGRQQDGRGAAKWRPNE